MSQSSASVIQPVPVPARTAPRSIVQRTRGNTHGPITRFVSPGDVGELIKPFVFLDFFKLEAGGFGGFGWHPHSGIATVSVILNGSTTYEETTGAQGVLAAGAVECMRAGGGVWHTGGPSGTEPVVGYQLWVSLPAELENAPAASQYLQPQDVPQSGPFRVILGQYGGLRSSVTALPMNYLVVDLKDGERWSYQPPAGHTVGWVAVHRGTALSPSAITQGELAVFEASDSAIDFVAQGDTSFVLGSALPHPHELVLGRYSVHTSAEALKQGETEIMRILRDDPVLRSKLR